MDKIGFIGCGNIAKAILKGAVSSGVICGEDVVCFDIDASKTIPFTDLGAKAAASPKELAENLKCLFLTVKPQILPTVLEELKPHISDETFIISPVAGVKIDKINTLLGGNKKIIRVMPNTPLMYSAGATALSRGAGVSDEEFAFAKKIFSSCGVTACVSEDQIDTVTGISGSSPAFFMRFAREIISAGVNEGMERSEAEKLVLQTMFGTAKMAMESDNTIDELIKAVASPGGTTEAGLKTMDRLDFDRSTAEVTAAAIKRSRELSK